jgi:hypothetical protein
VFTNNFTTAVRSLALAAILSLGFAQLSNAGDTREISPAEYKKTEAMMRAWLTQIDKAKYAESFATASESFRKGLSVEKSQTNHAKMLADIGPVVSRGKIDSFTTKEKPSSETLPSTYQVIFKTKFKKKSAREFLEIVKENREWKVANYLILPD